MAAAPDPEIEVEELTVDRAFHRFVEDELLPGTGVAPSRFWRGLSELVHTFGPRNRELLATRASMQAAIDDWHRARRDEPLDPEAYRRFLEELGYLDEDEDGGPVPTVAVDPEIGEVAGPQLVVPVDNARYAINAANARWGSLYDALYGTDALGGPPPDGPYDPTRGARVIAWVRDLLDAVVPLATGSHAEVAGYRVVDGALRAERKDGATTGLAEPSVFRGHLGDAGAPTAILLSHHGLGIEIVVDRSTSIGRDDDAGVADVHLEAAVTTIMDCEDSVAAVDSADKIGVYRNWLGLMKGDLVTEVSKGSRSFVRRMETDVTFTGPDGAPVRQRRRSLMLVRNVGPLMTTPVAHDRAGEEIFEGLLDALVTATAARHDLARDVDERNSAVGAIYVVKPKLHGPDEVTFTDEVFAHVEDVLELPRATIRLGLMDEERRTTLNLATCIRRAGERIAFINTGFLDRTGDEMHTSMEAGPMVRKADMKTQPWLLAYEDANVDVGLQAGLRSRAQIGKGMWAAPERMHAMLEEKIGHPRAGASCAWVPSPTAATLHATHYHRVDVHARQAELEGQQRASLEGLLTIPVAPDPTWSDDERQQELDNNVQGILGYVVRWVQLGIGCSKVPDIHDVALMEDRATCRISSQHVANWLHHGVIDEDRTIASFRRMARIVDAQNAGVPGYRPMAPGFADPAFLAACDLVFLGRGQPSGYTEPILHARRAEWRARLARGGR